MATHSPFIRDTKIATSLLKKDRNLLCNKLFLLTLRPFSLSLMWAGGVMEGVCVCVLSKITTPASLFR